MYIIDILSCGWQPMQAGLFLTPAQKLLHDHLVQKSERLQDTIRQQQEELRQITQQLAQAQTGVQSSLIAVPEPGEWMKRKPKQHLVYKMIFAALMKDL